MHSHELSGIGIEALSQVNKAELVLQKRHQQRTFVVLLVLCKGILLALTNLVQTLSVVDDAAAMDGSNLQKLTSFLEAQDDLPVLQRISCDDGGICPGKSSNM